jgi:hypothetical protein
MAPMDPNQTTSSSSTGGGGFFASIASSLSNFGSSMTKSVNGYQPSHSMISKAVKFIYFFI